MTRALDMTPGAVTARLFAASELADLSPERRLDAKIGLDPRAVTARLRVASELRDLCRALRAAGRAHEERARDAGKRDR